MLKRLLCCILICALLAAVMPTIAFAGDSYDALKKLMGMRYLDKVCAINANAANWHDGMKLTHANSQQMETALTSLLEDEILPTLEYLEQSVRAQVATGAEGALSDELRQARDDCRALRDEVQAELDIIVYERKTVPATAKAVFNGTFQTENQAEAAAQRTLLGVDRLENSMAVVSSGYSDWEDEVERMRALVLPDDRTVPVSSAPKTQLQSHIIGVRADYMNAMMAEAKRVAAEEQGFFSKAASKAFNAENEVEIYAVPRDKILFDIRDENNAPLSNARVVAWNAKDKFQYVGTYDADAEGYLFSTKSLGLEADGYLEIGYEIICSGYESHYSNRHLCQGGDIFHTEMKTSDGTPYISGTSINGMDMQWSHTNVYITDANDANQTVSVYLDSDSSVSSRKVTMFYNDRNGNPQQVSATAARASDGRIRADFVGKWCRIFNIGDPVSFSLDQDAYAPLDSLLMTNEPAVNVEGANKPSAKTDNKTLLKRFLPSEDALKGTFPESIPVIGGSMFSLTFPGEQMPVTLYEGLDGTYLLIVNAGKKYKDFLQNNVEEEEWKTESQEETDREVSNIIEESEEDIKSAESSFVKDDNAVSKPFIGKFSAWWSLFFCAQGKMETLVPNDPPYVTGQVSAGFTIGMKAEFSKMVLATPPLKLNIGFSVGLGAMIYGLYEGYMTDFQCFNFSKLNVDFGAVSIVIPTSAFISFGVGVELLNAGVKGSVSLNLALPIIADDYRNNVTVALDMRILIYAQLGFCHIDWLIARFGWSFENGKSNDIDGYIIGIGHLPKAKSVSSGFSMPNAAPSKAFLKSGSDHVLGDVGTRSNNLEVDTSVIWNYEPASVDGSKAVRVSSTLPRSFELYNGNAVDMAVWAENNRILLSANGMDNAQELVIPEDPNGAYTPLSLAKKGIESGAYKIIDVNANTGDMHYDYIGSFRMPVEVAAVSVTYAKSFKTETQTIGEKTEQATVPKETETLSMALVLTMDSTTPLMLTTDQGDPAAYVFLNTTDAIKEIYPYPCQIHLKESPLQSGLPCIDTGKSFGIVTGALFKDGSLASAFYHYGSEDYYEEYSDCTFRILETGTTGDIPTYIGVDNDGTIAAGVFSNVLNEEYEDFADGDDIDDFVLYDLEDSDGEMVAFYLEKTTQEGLDALKAVPMKMSVGQTPRNAMFAWSSEDQWDFETDIPATKLSIGRLIDYQTLNATLYWFDTGLKQIGTSDEKQEIARVRGVYFDWFHRKASKPFSIATLYGNDGDTGGLSPNLAPLTSFNIGGRFYFARALSKDNPDGENDSLNWQQGPYMVYSAPVSNVVKMRVVSATAEHHAMSAGRSGNFTFTLLNDGNTPITSVTMRVSRVLKNPDGSEKLETIAEYTLDPSDESANSANFWSVNSSTPDVRNGIAAVRQVDTLFDTLPGDMLLAANNANGNQRLLEAFLPENVFAYKSTIAIPEDWDGLQLLRAEVVRAYGPIQSSAVTGVTRYAMYDLKDGGVYGMDEQGRVSSEPLIMAGGAPLRVQRSTPVDLLIDTAEVCLSCKMHEKNGEKYIASAISQTGNTAMNSSRGNITLRAYINDETMYPTYVHTFKNHTTGDICLNIDAPVSVLTGGRAADKLTLVVSDDADANRDLSLLNNYQTFLLNDALRWRVQPTNQTVKEGNTAVFTAEAYGGTRPYSYKWYQINGSDSWEVGSGDTLVLDNCTTDMNGNVYFCVAMDMSGQTIISEQAVLRVQKIVPPKTGDSNPVYFWMALAAANLIALLFLISVRKRRSHR